MRRYHRLIQQGLCVECSKVAPRENKRMCENCAKTAKERSYRTFSKRRDSGGCSYCPDGRPAPGKKVCRQCIDQVRARNADLKKDAIDHYGGCCSFCGEKDPKFLTVDHIHNDGAAHRKSTKCGSGNVIYRWLKTKGYPSGFQILCWNCNCAKQFHRYNPHEDPELLLAATGVI